MSPRQQKVANIWIEDGWVKLRMPYYDEAAVADLKASFCADWRTYDRKTNTWSILITQFERVVAFARTHFANVVRVGEVPKAITEEIYLDELAELLRDLPSDVLHKVYKLLMFECHPDRGGDPVLAARINAAWAKIA